MTDQPQPNLAPPPDAPDKPSASAPDSSAAPHPTPRVKPRRRRLRRLITFALLFAVVLLLLTRPMMPWAVRWYVNRTLDRSELYRGQIGDVDLHLWRGAYSIKDVRINKVTGNVPVPLFSAPRVDFAVQWDALLHGKVVGQFVVEKPELNFVSAPDAADSQTGDGGPWLQIIKDLFPFKINSARIRGGSVHFRAVQREVPVDVYLSHFDATLENLTNIRDETTPLITTAHATALAMDQARFELDMKLDPFAYRPTFHMAARLVGLDVTKLNTLARSYGALDFERGWFDLVIETESTEGRMTGYVKPLFRDLKVLTIPKDLKEDNVLEFFWEALVGAATGLIKNHPRDQFGTLIPFTADVTGTRPDILATIGNVLRNAFVRAYLPKLQPSPAADTGLQFAPAEITQPGAQGDQ